jgi:hypothetical protein
MLTRAGWISVTSSKFDVLIVDLGKTTPQLIKALRKETNAGLKETAELLNSPLPIIVFRQLDETKARNAKAFLEKAGAKVILSNQVAVSPLHSPVKFDVISLVKEFERNLEGFSSNH